MHDTPQSAEAAFYRAFEEADIEAMMRVWAAEGAVLCVHPMGARLEGLAAIEESWRAIFAHSGDMRFHLVNAHYMQDASVSVHCVHELISFGEQMSQRSLVIATNVYRLTPKGWRICVHHASPGRVGAVPARSAEGLVH